MTFSPPSGPHHTPESGVWLSQIDLSPHGRHLPFDSQKMHGFLSRVMSGYVGRVLWAHPRPGVVIVQAPAPVRAEMVRGLARGVYAAQISHHFVAGARVELAGIVSPTRAIHTQGARGRVVCIPASEAEGWVRRKFEGTLTISALSISDMSPARGIRAGRPIMHGRASISMAARVSDPAALSGLLSKGVGRGKAYGCGLVLAKEWR